MVFYVYLDPEVIPVAASSPPYGVQTLIAILRGFLQNCCIAEFEDYRVQTLIREYVEALPNDFDRKAVKTLLIALQKRNRFVYCLVPEYGTTLDDDAIAMKQAPEALIDLLLLGSAEGCPRWEGDTEIATLDTYQHTHFETTRSRLASDGKTLNEGALEEVAFLDQNLLKALRFARRIEVCDRLFGSKFGDNFEYTTRTTLRWLEIVLADPANCVLIFHCEKPDGKTDRHITMRLKSWRTGRLAKTPIHIQFYELPEGANCLPHERFIFTDQIALEVGRGMDFLDRQTHKNRDISLGYKSAQEVQKLLKAYAAGALPPVVIF